MRRQFLALLTGALVLVLSGGVGLSAAAGSATSAATGKDVKPQKHNFKSSLNIREEKSGRRPSR